MDKVKHVIIPEALLFICLFFIYLFISIFVCLAFMQEMFLGFCRCTLFILRFYMYIRLYNPFIPNDFVCIEILTSQSAFFQSCRDGATASCILTGRLSHDQGCYFCCTWQKINIFVFSFFLVYNNLRPIRFIFQ